MSKSYWEFLKGMKRLVDESIKEEEAKKTATKEEQSEAMKVALLSYIGRKDVLFENLEIVRPSDMQVTEDIKEHFMWKRTFKNVSIHIQITEL